LAERRGWPVSLKIPTVGWRAIVLAELLLLLLLVLTHLAIGRTLEAALAGQGGGLVGWAGSALLTGLVGRVAAWGIVLTVIGFTAWLLCRQLLGLRVEPSGDRSAQGLRASSDSVRVRSRSENTGPAKQHRVMDPPLGAKVLAWWGVVLRGLLPRGDEPAIQEEHLPPSGSGRRSSPPQAVRASAMGPSSGGKPTSQSTPIKQATAKERLFRPKPRPDTLPPFDLLRPDQGALSVGPDVRLRAQTLKQTLAEFGVPVEVVSIKEGPTVTQFGLEPGEVIRELRNGEVYRRRVSVHSILRLSNDLALALSAPSIRIEAPVPGRPYVGVEVPNAAKTLVSLRGVLESNEFARVASPLAVALGRDVSGDVVVLDLAALPHLLIAGATGSGKSVCINSIVCSLLMSNDPVTVRLVMVDPKMVELPAYNGVPHLLGHVITDPAQVPAALAWLTLQMDERYRIFANSGVRNIAGYNRKAAKSPDLFLYHSYRGWS
jgi:S-DNA-T family DNA segregation ATPase FtsK/SpoIIIE